MADFDQSSAERSENTAEEDGSYYENVSLMKKEISHKVQKLKIEKRRFLRVPRYDFDNNHSGYTEEAA